MIIVHKPGEKSPGGEQGFLERHILQHGEDIVPTTVWIDMIEPTRDDDRIVESWLGIEIPTRDEMQDIEPSSLLYTENSARYMTARILCHSDTQAPKLVPVSFILTERAIVTVRYDEPRSFQMFANRAIKPGGCGHQPEAVLDGLIETVIDRAAEILRKVGDDIEMTSRNVFEREVGAAEKGDAYQKVIRSLGRYGDLISNVRESMVSLERMLLFLSANMQRPQRTSGFQSEWRTAVRDVQSIEEHANFLNSKIQFILEATLGLVSIEQNKIIKLFSVMSVVMMPPTLIASIYGMNFKKWFPELEWEWGYPMALGFMVFAAVVPYVIFKQKKWL
ncbi:MAG: magnesium transporter CorA family protein [Beijerinckiaceae bacterium]